MGQQYTSQPAGGEDSHEMTTSEQARKTEETAEVEEETDSGGFLVWFLLKLRFGQSFMHVGRLLCLGRDEHLCLQRKENKQ